MIYDADVTINSVDLSDHVKSVAINYDAAMLNDSNMGDDTEINLAGLKKWGMVINFSQDYAAAKVDATLFPLIGAAAFTVAVRPTSAVASATNPEYGGSAVLESYPPMGGAHGDHHESSASFRSASTLTRTTS
jgi:hypothetical protein